MHCRLQQVVHLTGNMITQGAASYQMLRSPLHKVRTTFFFTPISVSESYAQLQMIHPSRAPILLMLPMQMPTRN